VQADEFDNGERKLLNFGHTVGHAIEKISGYQCPHAVAVGMGMEIITKISENLGLTEKGTHSKIKVLLGRFHVYNKIDINVMDICDNLKNDKKVNGEYIDLILLKRIGDAYVYSLHKDKLKVFFGAYYG
jgi:3-dehydroquinate synthase